MGLQRYLAMTAAEFSSGAPFPENPAWMACHFSSYGLGLSNLPTSLPEGSMVIVNDRTPPQGHDPVLIAEQLRRLQQELNVSRFLLDFQRPNDPETKELASVLIFQLDGPVAVTEEYAKDLQCPVFVSAPPPHKDLAAHLAPWSGREIWLESALETERAVVTQKGCQFAVLADATLDEPIFTDHTLHCRYHTQISDKQAVFTMQRREDELFSLLEEAQTLGVALTVGLYQQLAGIFS